MIQTFEEKKVFILKKGKKKMRKKKKRYIKDLNNKYRNFNALNITLIFSEKTLRSKKRRVLQLHFLFMISKNLDPFPFFFENFCTIFEGMTLERMFLMMYEPLHLCLR